MSRAEAQTIDTHHTDMIHDAQLDYYSSKLATASSDKTIKIFEVDGDSQRLVETLVGHEGPVWQVAWAHPKFGTILASCCYNGSVFIWKEQNNQWTKIKEHKEHQISVNSIAWAPHELGAILACASADGKVSILEYKDDGSWETSMIDAHSVGCNAVTWSPAAVPGSLVSSQDDQIKYVKRFVTGGCDSLVKIWTWSNEKNSWDCETLEGHTDWVRDVAWAPNIGLPKSYLASCSQDRTVLIWTQESPDGPWTKKSLGDKFKDALWRVSWSLSGNILAVSSADNQVTLWKEDSKGEWECIKEMTEGH